MVVSIPTRSPGTPDPAGDVNAIVAELNRVAAKVDAINFDAQSFGLVNNGLSSSAAANTTAIANALTAAANAGGGTVRIPPGDYYVNGGFTLPKLVNIVGAEEQPRYYGYMTGIGESSSSLILVNPTQSFMFKAATDMRGSAIKHISLIGNNATRSGSLPVDCLDTTAAPNEMSFAMEHVSINGFSGNGIVGRLSVVKLTRCDINGNRGYGATTSTSFWTDTWFDTCLINGNVTGGINVDGTSQSGLVHFTNTRFERSGWDPVNLVGLPAGVGSPGIRLRNIKNSLFLGCSTDGNSGNGLDIQRADGSGKNVFSMQFIGCTFNRDGYGAYKVGSSPTGAEIDPSTLDYACVWIDGQSAASSIDTLTFVGCTIGYGRPIDGGSGVTLYPKYGLKMDWAFYLSWIGGNIGVADTSRNVVSTNEWKPAWLMPQQFTVIPSFATTATPTYRPAGSIWIDTTKNKILFTPNGTTVHEVTSASITFP